MEPLVDGHGRQISDLRVSVTDRCNFRCQYCMPADGLPWLDRSAVLSFEEIERLVRVFAGMGVDGRAAHRRRAARAARLPDAGRHARAGSTACEDLSLTTNGYLLERDADALVAAGIDRVNVSIDSLQRDRFFQITRRDSLPQVLRGLEALASHPEVHPVKVNAVAMRGFTEQEAIPFAEFARSTAFQVRFIEFMPLDADHAWTPDSRAHRRRAARASSTRCIRSRSCRASRRRPRASTASATAAARSASSTRCRSRSAPTATGSA